MDRNFSSSNSDPASSLKESDKKSQHENHSEEAHLEADYMSPFFDLQNVSKLILPPLGVARYDQNPESRKRWIISPMDSRYR